MKRERGIESEEKSLREVFHPEMLGIEVALKNAPLWKQFHGEGTEMIITKSGRRMFPSLRIGLTGLEADSRYFVLLETSLADCHRYKFTAAEWAVVGGAEPQTHSSTRLYVHPDSPATGASWMAQDVLFHRAKLTNNTLDRSGNLVLTSMHKYQPRIHVIKASDILALHWSPTLTVTFPETEFIAVTAYQNEKITKLKIDNNPFAKGFRESGMAHTKKKCKTRGEEEEEEEESLRGAKKLKDEAGGEAASPPSSSSERSTPSTPPPLPGKQQHLLPTLTDDSGVSVGSASPAPLLSPSTSPLPAAPLHLRSAFLAGHGHPSQEGQQPSSPWPPTLRAPPPHSALPQHYLLPSAHHEMPPPTPFYPHTLWPYQPFPFYHPFAYYPPPFHHIPSPSSLFDLASSPHPYPFNYSLKQ